MTNELHAAGTPNGLTIAVVLSVGVGLLGCITPERAGSPVEPAKGSRWSMTPQLQQGSQRLDADRLAQALIRIGEDGIAKENDAAFEAYFARDFVFHGPQGDSSRSEL